MIIEIKKGLATLKISFANERELNQILNSFVNIAGELNKNNKENKMNSYTFIGTEQDLLDNGFMYRPHRDNYIFGYFEENYETKQDLFIEVNHKTKEVDIYIHALNGHRNKTYLEEGVYLIQADIYPIYFKIINELIEKNIIKEKENERSITIIIRRT